MNVQDINVQTVLIGKLLFLLSFFFSQKIYMYGMHHLPPQPMGQSEDWAFPALKGVVSG